MMRPHPFRRFVVRLRLAIGRPIWWLLMPAYRERFMRPVDVRIYREDGIVNEEIARLHRAQEEILRLRAAGRDPATPGGGKVSLTPVSREEQ